MNTDKLLKLNLQHFARAKNALTKYYVAEIPEGDTGEPEYKQLARWISTVEDDSDEETEEQAFYDGDGTPETDVMSVSKAFAFEGMYDDTNEAMMLIESKEFETGEGRKVMFKQERTNGKTLEGPATLTGIIVSGGEASEYAAFECTIAWDRKPEITEAQPTG